VAIYRRNAPAVESGFARAVAVSMLALDRFSPTTHSPALTSSPNHAEKFSIPDRRRTQSLCRSGLRPGGSFRGASAGDGEEGGGNEDGCSHWNGKAGDQAQAEAHSQANSGGDRRSADPGNHRHACAEEARLFPKAVWPAQTQAGRDAFARVRFHADAHTCAREPEISAQTSGDAVAGTARTQRHR